MPQKYYDEEDVQPWDRMERESASAYEAFTSYLLMGAARGIRSAARKDGKPKSTYIGFSKRWNWAERSRAWDNSRLKERQQEAKDQEKAARERQRKIGELLQSKATRWVNSVAVEDIDGHVAVKMMQLGVQLENAAISKTIEELYAQNEVTDAFLAGVVNALREGRAAQRAMLGNVGNSE